METITVTGIVLSSMQIGENDRRIVILTKDQGKISAFARGACRPKSQLFACSRVFAAGEFVLYPGRDSYSLQSAEIRDYFSDLLLDYDKMAYGCYFMELTGYFAVENADATELLNLVFLTLKTLERQKLPFILIRMIFEFRLFAIHGVYPQVFVCSECNKTLKQGYFALQRGCSYCESCLSKPVGTFLPAAAVYTLQYIYTVPLKRLYQFQLKEEIFRVVMQLLEQWKKLHLDREFRSFSLVKMQEDTQNL